MLVPHTLRLIYARLKSWAVMRVDMVLDAEVNVRINVKTDTVTRSMASVYMDVQILML